MIFFAISFPFLLKTPRDEMTRTTYENENKCYVYVLMNFPSHIHFLWFSSLIIIIILLISISSI